MDLLIGKLIGECEMHWEFLREVNNKYYNKYYLIYKSDKSNLPDH